MSGNSKIDYIHASINPGGWGCFGPNGSEDNPNHCPYCYAHRQAKRKLRACPHCRDFVPHWHEEELEKLYKWRKPKRIFVQSMGDLFYSGMPLLPLCRLFGTMHSARHHTYLVLTKNPFLMQRFIKHFRDEWLKPFQSAWPREYQHVWLGVSVTNQQDAEERLPILLDTPAAHRWVSIEPIQDYVYLGRYLDMLDWVVIGVETGKRIGKVIPERHWIQALVERCEIAGVPIFMKRNLARIWGDELIQEYPEGMVRW